MLTPQCQCLLWPLCQAVPASPGLFCLCRALYFSSPYSRMAPSYTHEGSNQIESYDLTKMTCKKLGRGATTSVQWASLSPFSDTQSASAAGSTNSVSGALSSIWGLLCSCAGASGLAGPLSEPCAEDPLLRPVLISPACMPWVLQQRQGPAETRSRKGRWREMSRAPCPHRHSRRLKDAPYGGSLAAAMLSSEFITAVGMC